MHGTAVLEHRMPDRVSPVVVPLTPPGRGAIATLLVEGAGALAAVHASFRSARGRPIDSSAADRLRFGHLGPGPGEEVVVRVRSERSVELHCHGGRAAVAMVEQTLVEQGCRPVSWQEWTRRSSEDPIRAAARLALAEARTERTASVLLDQYQGALRRAIGEAAECLDRRDLAGAQRKLEELISRAALGLRLIRPWRVVLAGLPNAGKSTLLNAMVGYARAIVDPQAGTTRDLVTAVTALDGWPVELCDTAGLREANHPVEQAGVDAARRSLATADLVLLVFDLSQPWSPAADALLASHPGVMTVHNKNDLASPADPARPAGHRVSALRGEGIERLLDAIAARLVPTPPAPGAAVPFTQDQAEALARSLEALAAGDVARGRQALHNLAPG